MPLTRHETFHSAQPVLKSHWAVSVTPARDALVALCVSTALAPKFNERCPRHSLCVRARQTGEERLRAPPKAIQAFCRSCGYGRHTNHGHPVGGLQESARAVNRSALDAPAGDCRRSGGAGSSTRARCGSASASDRAADAGRGDVRSAQARGREWQAPSAAVARPDDRGGHFLDGDRAGQLRRRNGRSLQVQVLGQGQSE